MKKIENIFIWTSIIFLIGIVGFFSYRFIHYYRLSHNRDVISNDLYEIILDNRAILNLRKVDNSYYYTENNGNNYVIYSGILWRIIKLENNKLTLISDVPVTNLYYDDVLDYLNNEFFEKLDYKDLLQDTTLYTKDYNNKENDLTKEKIIKKIGIPNILDIKFDNEVTNYYLPNKINTFALIYNNPIIYGDTKKEHETRYTITLSKDIIKNLIKENDTYIYGDGNK